MKLYAKEIFIAASILALVTVLTLLLYTSGCAKPQQCSTVGATRCQNNRVEYCTKDGWVADDNCSEVWLMDGDVVEMQCCVFEEAVCMTSCTQPYGIDTDVYEDESAKDGGEK